MLARTAVASLSIALALTVSGFAQDASIPQPDNNADGQESLMLIVDASGSMRGRIEGRSKWEIAKETIAQVVGDLPSGREIGLMAYGHRGGKCKDIELLQKPMADAGLAVIEAIKRMRPRGETPIAATVRQAAEVMKYQEKPATVVIVTDGIESCGGDVCQLGLDLAADGIDFTAHVIGFGLSEKDGAAVACLAQNTGGMYLAANDADQLQDALRETVEAPVDVTPQEPKAKEPTPAVFAADFKNGLDLNKWEVVNENAGRFGIVDGKLTVGGKFHDIFDDPEKQNLLLAKAEIPAEDFDLSIDFSATMGDPRSMVTVGVYKDEKDFVQATFFRDPGYNGVAFVEVRRMAGGQATLQRVPVPGLDEDRVGNDGTISREHINNVGARLKLMKRGIKAFAQFEYLDPPKDLKATVPEAYSKPVQTDEVSVFSPQGRLAILGGIWACPFGDCGENVVRFDKVELRTP